MTGAGELADDFEHAIAPFLFGALRQFSFDGNKRTAWFLVSCRMAADEGVIPRAGD